ncbi:MAG TPA: hypothetical protein VNP37_01415 [Actinomycetospora sp.]|nr:hypothetical protein [Actinomycetospora sp.]
MPATINTPFFDNARGNLGVMPAQRLHLARAAGAVGGLHVGAAVGSVRDAVLGSRC